MPRIDPHVSSDLCALSIADLVDLIARREVSPVEMAHASLARYEATEPDLNAFISIDRNLVIADAARLETEARRGEFRGSLHGVPIAIKDNIATRGEPTTAGSRVYGARVPDRDATVVARLRAAGALIFGKTNLPEFAYGPVDAYHFGPTRNPGIRTGTRAGRAWVRVPRSRPAWCPAHWAPTRRARSETPRHGAASSGSSPRTASSRCVVSSRWRRASITSARSPARRPTVPAFSTVIAGVDHNDPTAEPYPPANYLDGLDRTMTGLRLGRRPIAVGRISRRGCGSTAPCHPSAASPWRRTRRRRNRLVE